MQLLKKLYLTAKTVSTFYCGILLILSFKIEIVNGQIIYNQIQGGYSYTVYDFPRTGNIIKAKYFAQNAYTQFLNWRGNKSILLVTSGAFSKGFEKGASPEGLCVDNGTVVNRIILPDKMDGLVIVYNGGDNQGGIAITDLRTDPVQAGGTKFYLRTPDPDGRKIRDDFFKWGESNGLTLFQTQLLYSHKWDSNITDLPSNQKRERRLLAICHDSNKNVHHVIINASLRQQQTLKSATENAIRLLSNKGLTAQSIMNLDTGCKNILYLDKDGKLENVLPESSCDSIPTIKEATNLLIYYKD